MTTDTISTVIQIDVSEVWATLNQPATDAAELIACMGAALEDIEERSWKAHAQGAARVQVTGWGDV